MRTKEKELDSIGQSRDSLIALNEKLNALGHGIELNRIPRKGWRMVGYFTDPDYGLEQRVCYMGLGVVKKVFENPELAHTNFSNLKTI